MKNFKLSNCLLKKCWHKVSTFKRYCSSQSRETWKSVVGLEIHAQLNSKTKLFSGSPNRFGGVVNNDVSLFDAAIPGTLPVLNRRCVELGIITALALSCKINEVSMFDRKHYFYADLPAGYQITQQRAPLANDGIINFQVYTPGVHKKPYKKYSKIKQIQLEQDSGKSLHDSELKQSLVDLNRAGVPLIELVFEPDLEDGEEAAALVKELVLIVQRLGVCSGRMEEGALRVDANVSVHRPGEPLGTRTEIKNIGSIRGVAGAIRHEVGRQLEVLKNGGCIVNETRAWDAVARRTVAMRDKEQVQDYRFMPEPNLPPLRVNLTIEKETPDVISVPRLYATLPELPEQTRQNLIQKYELKPTSVIQLVNEPILLQYFSNVVLSSDKDPNKVVNFLLNDLVTMLNKNKIHVEDCPLKDSQIIEILDLLAQKKIDLEGSRQLLDELLVKPDAELVKIMEQQHLLLVTDEEEIIRRCIKVIENNPKLVKKYKDGEVKVFKALLGILAKDTRPKLDMSIVSKKLEDLLKR